MLASCTLNPPSILHISSFIFPSYMFSPPLTLKRFGKRQGIDICEVSELGDRNKAAFTALFVCSLDIPCFPQWVQGNVCFSPPLPPILSSEHPCRAGHTEMVTGPKLPSGLVGSAEMSTYSFQYSKHYIILFLNLIKEANAFQYPQVKWPGQQYLYSFIHLFNITHLLHLWFAFAPITQGLLLFNR